MTRTKRDAYDTDYAGWAEALLPEGTRIHHALHPELTGVIKHYEWSRDGCISAVPYCIGWDDSHLAAETLGWFFVYAMPLDVVEDR